MFAPQAAPYFEFEHVRELKSGILRSDFGVISVNLKTEFDQDRIPKYARLGTEHFAKNWK